MTQVCSVCRHARREEIEIAVIRRTPYRDIARLHGLSKDAVARHATVHIPESLARSEDARDLARAETILEQITGLRDAALAVLTKAEQSGESETALKAVREARGCVELLAKVMGELKEGPTINVLMMPEWVQVQAVILNALDSHPQARIAVAGALRQLEAPNAHAA